MVFAIGCASQEFESLDFSDLAKEKLSLLLQKPPPDTFEVVYNFHSSIGSQSLVNITFYNAKQGNKQRKDTHGNMFDYNLNASSVINGKEQVTCAMFDNEWKCSPGDKVCSETPKGRLCQSVSNENVLPVINLEDLAKAKVAFAEQKQMFGMQLQCYKILTTQDGNKALTEVCFNKHGMIMLIAINTKLFQAVMEAKSFSTEVNPEVFVMPTITR